MLLGRPTASKFRTTIGTVLLPLLALAIAGPPQAAHATPPSGYTLAWDEEFNGPVGSGPNLQNWGYGIGNNSGWGNGDLENYADDTTHCSIISDPNATDGLALQIEATHDDSTYNAGDFTSARIESVGKVAEPYGYVEVRAKAPVGGAGIWPAVWMLGQDYTTVSWPDCGEADLIEFFGTNMNQVMQSFHVPNADWSTAYSVPSGSPAFNAAYHVYGYLWTPTTIETFVDGNLVESHEASDSPGWIFNHPFFFIVNMAIGGPGSAAGTPNSSVPFPQYFDVDYIRYYAPPSSATVSAGYGTVTDPCDNFSVAYETSGGDLTIDNSNPQLFNGDAGRISRVFDDTAWVDYKYQNITAASVTVGTNTNDNTPVTLLYSTNGGVTWLPASTAVTSVTPTQSGWGYYTVSTTGLPNATDLKVQMAPTVIAWDHQLMSVTLTTGQPIAAPPAPTELTATPINNGVVLNWVGSTGATSYNIYRNTTEWDEIAAPPINAVPVATGVTGSSYTDTGLTDGTTYYYMVAAADSAGVSGQTPEASATPSASCTAMATAPTGLTASNTTSNSTSLSWAAVTAPGGCTLANYVVYENGVAVASSTVNGWVVTGLAPSTTYQFTVASTDGDGVSSQSSSISVTTAAGPGGSGGTTGGGGSCAASPSAPTGLAASGTTSSGTTLTWSAVTPPSNCSIEEYTVYQNGTQIATVSSGTSFAVTGLSASTTYSFTVTATDFNGTSPQSSALSVTTSAASSCSAAPSAPTGLAATGTSSTGTTLTWNAVTPPSNCSISSYTIYKNGASIGTSTSTSFAVTGLTASTTYSFTVAATDSAGTSSQSSTLSVTTSAPPSCAAAPSAPSGLTASSTTSSGTTLTWNAVTPPSNCSISSYTIYENGTSIGTSTSTSFAVTGLTASTTYSFTVAATDSVGTSSQSSAVSVTTGSPSQTLPLLINCGGSASGSWLADEYYSGGTTVSVTNSINLSGAPSPAPTQGVMQTERDGTVTYTIPGLTANSAHTVCLFFSENTYTGNGQREFNVAINGTTVLSNFDVYANTGSQYKAIEQCFSSNANSSGQITITLTSVVASAEINGIAIE